MYMSKAHYTLGNLWLVWSPIIRFGKSEANKAYDRPVVTIMQTDSGGQTFIAPGSSKRKKGEGVISVSAKKCRHLNRDTYFLVRFTQLISTKELWDHLGELPNNYRDELREMVFPVLLKEYGIRPS